MYLKQKGLKIRGSKLSWLIEFSPTHAETLVLEMLYYEESPNSDDTSSESSDSDDSSTYV